MRLIRFITFLWTAQHVDTHHLKMAESVVDVRGCKCDILGFSDKVTMPVPVSEL